MARNRAKGISEAKLMEIAREAKSAGLTGQQFRDRVRVTGGYASDASVSQLVHNVRSACEIIVEQGGEKHPAYSLATEMLELLAFERATRNGAGSLFGKFVKRDDGVLRVKNSTIGGLNLADESAE